MGSAVTDLIDAFATGKNPAKAFFNSIIQSLEQVIAKIIQAQIEQIILNTLFKAASAAINPLSILGLVGLESGGRPHPGKVHLVGEKGPELFISDQAGTILSNQKSVSFLTDTVNEHNSIKEYILSSKINTAFKEYTSHISDSIKESIKIALVPIHSKLSETIKSIATTSEKLTAYSYKLHEITTNKFSNTSEKENSSENIQSSFVEKISKYFDRVTERVIINNFHFKESFSAEKLSKETFSKYSLQQLQHKFNIPAFASGGAVFGPTLAILGEGFGISRSNPEFVGTASQLKGIQGGAFDVNVNVNGDISFDMGKLAIALNREERSHIRTNGKKPF